LTAINKNKGYNEFAALSTGLTTCCAMMVQVLLYVCFNIGSNDNVYVFPRCANEDAWHGASAVANEMVQELHESDAVQVLCH